MMYEDRASDGQNGKEAHNKYSPIHFLYLAPHPIFTAISTGILRHIVAHFLGGFNPFVFED